MAYIHTWSQVDMYVETPKNMKEKCILLITTLQFNKTFPNTILSILLNSTTKNDKALIF